MAGLRDTARRNRVAADLLGLESQGNSAINQLVSVKTNILTLKQAVSTEPIFTAEEEIEVEGVIAELAHRIQTELLGG